MKKLIFSLPCETPLKHFLRAVEPCGPKITRPRRPKRLKRPKKNQNRLKRPNFENEAAQLAPLLPCETPLKHFLRTKRPCRPKNSWPWRPQRPNKGHKSDSGGKGGKKSIILTSGNKETGDFVKSRGKFRYFWAPFCLKMFNLATLRYTSLRSAPLRFAL